jgi:hypothetical protein
MSRPDLIGLGKSGRSPSEHYRFADHAWTAQPTTIAVCGRLHGHCPLRFRIPTQLMGMTPLRMWSVNGYSVHNHGGGNMFEDIAHRSEKAWSNVFTDFKHSTWSDVGIVTTEGILAGGLMLTGRLATAKRMAGAADRLMPQVSIELENAEHLFPPGVTSFKHTLMEYARNPFTGRFAPLKYARAEFHPAGAEAAEKPSGPILNFEKAADGTYSIF